MWGPKSVGGTVGGVRMSVSKSRGEDGTSRRGGGRADVGAVGVTGGSTQGVGSDDPATVSMARSWLPACPAAPSRSTIAPPAVPTAASLGAMCAIALTNSLNDEHTQHRPRQTARTGAPWHTRNASPPGQTTGRSRKTIPAGRAPRHEDENGAAPTMLRGHQVRMVMFDGSTARCMSGVNVMGRVRAGEGALKIESCKRPSSPRPAHHLPLPSIESSLPIRSRPSADRPIVDGVAAASASDINLDGNNVHETLVREALIPPLQPYANIGAYSRSADGASDHVAGTPCAVVRVASVDLEGSKTRVTPTIACPRWKAFDEKGSAIVPFSSVASPVALLLGDGV